jgi:hypothetical protein
LATKRPFLALNEKRARKEEEKSEFFFLLTTGRHPKTLEEEAE